MHPIKRKQNANGISALTHGCVGGMEYLSFPNIDETGFARGYYSTRVGGASKGIYSTVNFAFTRGDDPEAVMENYRRMSAVINMSGESGEAAKPGDGNKSKKKCVVPEDFVVAHQTHTANVRVVTVEDRGKGVVRERDYDDVDGLITNVPGIVLTTFHADCVPVYFVDPVHRAIGLSHSGWKGTVGQISAETLRLMNETYGTEAKDCICAIGPSICKDCYEIGDDVAEQIRTGFSSKYDLSRILFSGNSGKQGKYQLDLWEACRQTLICEGVCEENIAVTDICTKCNSEFVFSHRVSGNQRGTNAAFLCII